MNYVELLNNFFLRNFLYKYNKHIARREKYNIDMIHRYDIIIYVKLDRYMIDQHISELLILGFKKLDQIRSPSFAKKPRLNDARRSIIQSQDRREVFNESHEFLASSRTQERVSFIGHFMRERQLTFFFHV